MPKPLLLIRPSGVYARFLLPHDMRTLIGRRFLVRSLRDFRADAARLVAAHMGYALAQLIQAHRAGRLSMSKKLIDDVTRAAAQGRLKEAYSVTHTPGGGITVQADTPEDHRMAMEIIGRIVTLPSALPHAAHPSGPMLHASIERFLTQYKKRGRAPATIVETEHTLHLLRDLVSDRPVSALRNEVLDEFRDDLAHWPARARVSARFKQATAREIVDAGRADRSLPKLEVRSLEKHLDRLSVFFNDLVQRNELPRNPLSGVTLQTKTAKYAQTYRGFKPAELTRLFDPHNRKVYQAGEPMLFWVPLLALFTGARLGELSGLMLDDLKQEDGVWGIHIIPNENRKLKNAQSMRFVPLPDRFLKLGFLKYTSFIAGMEFAELFPGGSERSKNGRGDGLSKHYGRTYLQAADVRAADVCFHSFRHTWATQADTMGLTEHEIGKITGHAPRSVLSKHYIDRKTIPERHRNINRVANAFVLPDLAPFDQRQFREFFDAFQRKQARSDARAARAARQAQRKSKRGAPPSQDEP